MHTEESHTKSFKISGKPVLSLILCSRNDQYMGNSRWRLETALNYVAKNVHELDRGGDVEVLVADWGSEIPLREVVELSPAAARIVSFLLIPPDIARTLQRDSPFPEVLALNAAARRARGQYIGRIDQDTLVGKRFLELFFEFHDRKRQPGVPLDSALLFANRRRVPYRFAVRCPSFWIVDWFVHRFGRVLTIETPRPPVPFYNGPVGIWLVHRNVWSECGGYDERMIYMSSMESDMAARLLEKYRMVDLGKLADYDFYHLEHFHPWRKRGPTRHRKTNREFCAMPNVFYPNSTDWGLFKCHLESLSICNRSVADRIGQSRFWSPAFLFLMCLVGIQLAWDSLILTASSTYALWLRRAGIAWASVAGLPLGRWPSVLRRLWAKRTVRLWTHRGSAR